MNIDEFLHLKGADRASLVASAQSLAELDESGVLLAVGSLAEGIGTIKSDMDLILVTPRDVGVAPNEIVSWVVGKCIVDCRVLSSAYVEGLLSRLDEWSQMPWDVTKPADFSYDELLLLHRLSAGVVLAPVERGDNVPKVRPSRRKVARLKLQGARHMARTYQVDMAGLKDAADFRSLVFAAQELLGHAVDGLLAAFMQTNPTPKWRSRLLEALPGDWETRLVLHPTGLQAHQLLWRLHRIPEEADEASCLAYGYRVTTFARAAFLLAEQKVLGDGPDETMRCRWPAEAPQRGRVPLPNLELDVDFRLLDDSVAVGRLNELGASTSLTSAEFLMMLLFDGVTTVREAEWVVDDAFGGEPSGEAVYRSVCEKCRAYLVPTLDPNAGPA